MALNYKRILSFIMIFALALATGFSIGKIYIDANAAPPITGSEAEFREDESVVEALVASSASKSVLDFNGIELFQIAEYKLNQTENFLKENKGLVTSFGQGIEMRSQKVKVGDDYAYYKLSPSKVVAGIETPQVCMRVKHNYKLGTTDVVPNKLGVMTNTESRHTLEAEFPSKGTSYSQEAYLEEFKTSPTTVMNYIVSNKTSEGCVTQVVANTDENGQFDGTYTFELNYKNKNGVIDAAFYYSYEILFSSGYSLPKWDQVKLTVTVNSDFTFKSITYVEKYSVNVPFMGMYIGVTNEMSDGFYYDMESISQNVMSDFKKFAEVE